MRDKQTEGSSKGGHFIKDGRCLICGKKNIHGFEFNQEVDDYFLRSKCAADRFKIENDQIQSLLGISSQNDIFFHYAFFFFLACIVLWIPIASIAHFWRGWNFFGIGSILLSAGLPSIILLPILSKSIREIKSVLKKNQGLLQEIKHYNQIIDNVIVLNQLISAGSAKQLPGQEHMLTALLDMKANIESALKTERILRENPHFNPENFSIDLTALQALQVNARSQEYATILKEALEVGINVQHEMKKIFWVDGA